jgi:spermidine synthase
MTETTEKHVELIFPEMMAHPVLFTHPNPKKIVLLGDDTHLILHEVLKHTNILEIHDIEPSSDRYIDNKLVFSSELSSLKADSIDIIINAGDFNITKQLFDLLQKDGILIQQSVSPFVINPLKSSIHTLHQTGFSDVQLLSFPQPNYRTGWRAILMALKHGMFRRLREKIIFNKPFKTAYYNFDVHKAATVLPEFIRDSNLF